MLDAGVLFHSTTSAAPLGSSRGCGSRLPSGQNIRYDPQNRSLGSPSFGDRPHSLAAWRLYRRTRPFRSQTYTANRNTALPSDLQLGRAFTDAVSWSAPSRRVLTASATSATRSPRRCTGHASSCRCAGPARQILVRHHAAGSGFSRLRQATHIDGEPLRCTTISGLTMLRASRTRG
jgi:hypothetical protein